MIDVSAAQARRIAIAAQGLNRTRPRGRIDRRHFRRVLDDTGVVQIDSVNVLSRSHYLPFFSRLGEYRRDRLDAMAAPPEPELVEYWAHEASLMTPATRRLFHWRMDAMHEGGSGAWPGLVRFAAANGELLDETLERLHVEGPMSARMLEKLQSGRRPKGSWWDWSQTKTALEWLFRTGRVGATRGPNFERIYHPVDHLLTPDHFHDVPDRSSALALLVESAARHLGVATIADLADYHRITVADCRTAVRDLVDRERLVEVKVGGWNRPGYMTPDRSRPRRQSLSALLSPFDSMVWCRPRIERLFDFHYRLEIYTPAARRKFGYYVLPFLHRDRLRARVDLKADRKMSRLLVHSAHGEPDDDADGTVEALVTELARLARFLGLDRVAVGDGGDLAPLIRRHGSEFDA